MNPKDVEVSVQWVNPTTFKPLPPGNNDSVYGKLVTYADGRVVLTRYKRGTGNLTADGQDQQEGETESLPPDPVVKKAWDEAQPKPQTPGQVAVDKNAIELQRQREKNAALPEGQDPKYETDAERADRAEKTIAAQKAEAKQAEADRIAAEKAAEVEARAKAAEVRAQQAADRQAAADARAADAGGTILDQGAEGVFIVKPDGTHVKTDIPTKPRPNTTVIVTDENKDQHTVTTDADGKSTVTPLNLPKKTAGQPIPSSATGWTPDPSQVDLGFGARRKQVAELLESGAIGDPTLQETVDKANALLKQDYETATLVSTNLGTIQTGETNIYEGSVTQRGQDTDTNANRLTAATNAFNTGMKAITEGAGKARSGAAVVGAMQEMLNNYKLFVDQFGASTEVPRVEPGKHMDRTAPVFQPLPAVGTTAPVEPGAAPVDPLAPTPPPLPPGTGLESAGPVGFPQEAPIPVDGVQPPPMPPVIGPDGVPIPAAEAPFVPPPTGAPGGPGWPTPPLAPAEPVSPTLESAPAVAPAAPVAPVMEPAPALAPAEPEYAPPTTLTEQATMAQRLMGVPETSAMLPSTPPPPLPPPTPFGTVDPLMAQQAQALVGGRTPTSGGTLSWAAQMGMPDDVLEAWMAIENGQAA